MKESAPNRRVLVATVGDLLTDLRQPMTPATRDWLAVRRRPGNWFDVSTDDEIPDDLGMSSHAILHFFQLVFAPELRRRIKQAQIDQSDFVLVMAQLLQGSPDQTKRAKDATTTSRRTPQPLATKVRLNTEVRGMANVRAQRQVAADDPVYVDDSRGLDAFDLDPSDLDAGHFTLFWVGVGWRAFFDFRSSRAKATNLLADAGEFLAATRFSAEQGNAKANVENMFNACELAAKAHLILDPGRELGKTHDSVHSAFNQWARYGNADDRKFKELCNRESSRRTRTRHRGADVVDPPSLGEIGFLETRIDSLNQALKHKIREGDLASQ